MKLKTKKHQVNRSSKYPFIIVLFNLVLSYSLYAQNSKIKGIWVWVGDSKKILTINDYFKIDTLGLNLIKNNDIDFMTTYNFKNNSILYQDFGDYHKISKYKIDYKKKILILSAKENTIIYDLIFLNKTDLILYDQVRKSYYFYVKKAEIFKRIKYIE